MTIVALVKRVKLLLCANPWEAPPSNEPPTIITHAIERWEEEAKLAVTLDQMKAIGKEVDVRFDWVCVHCHSAFSDMLTLNQHYDWGCPMRDGQFDPEADWAAYADSIEYAVNVHAANNYWHKERRDDV